MKRALIFLVAMAMMGAFADTWTDPETKITWTYTVSGGNASVEGASPAEGAIIIPSTLDDYPVTSIGGGAFSGCAGLTSVAIPEGVTSIEWSTFYRCGGLTGVTIPASMTNIWNDAFNDCGNLIDLDVNPGNQNYSSCDGVLYDKTGCVLLICPQGKSGSYEIPSVVTSISGGAFYGCSALMSVTVPLSVTNIEWRAFYACSSLREVIFEGDAPAIGDDVFKGTPSDLTVIVKEATSGWMQFGGRKLQYQTGDSVNVNVNLTITNIVVHYIQTSELSPMAAPITKDTGIVNVMTEIEGGNVAIPDSWADNYPGLEAKFGSNFTDALIAETGKFDAGGKPMLVWQDYVAGTDPTNPDDVFTASVTIVDGKPVISYTPELSDVEKAKRVYTTYGKVKLQDEKWAVVPEGREADYNFFKVSVRMK